MRTECSGKALGCPPPRPLQEAVTETKRIAVLLNTVSLQTPLSERPCSRLHQDKTCNAKVFPKPCLVLSAAFTVSCGEGAGRECDAGDRRDACGPSNPWDFTPATCSRDALGQRQRQSGSWQKKCCPKYVVLYGKILQGIVHILLSAVPSIKAKKPSGASPCWRRTEMLSGVKSDSIEWGL